MKLGDKAKQADQPEISLARQSAPGLYQLETDELIEADDLTEEGQFPQYGTFLKVMTSNGGREITFDKEEYIECPSALAKWLVDTEIEIGEFFRIQSVRKIDGNWQYDCAEEEDPTPTDE